MARPSRLTAHPSPGALLGGVFQRYLQRAIAPVEARNPFVSRVVLNEMITRQETKYALSLDELALRITGTQEELWRFWCTRGIETLSESAPAGVSHGPRSCTSALLPEIRRWLALSEEFVSFRDARRVDRNRFNAPRLAQRDRHAAAFGNNCLR